MENREAQRHYLRLAQQGDRQAAQYNYAAAIESYREALGYNSESANVYLAISHCLASQYDMNS